MADLKFGNVLNRLTAGNEAAQAQSTGYANLASSIADTLAGKDYQPGMSGLQQALVAGARGAATGFQNKAAMAKATAQDEMNAWAQTLVEDERLRAKSLEFAEKEKTAVMQASIPTLSAYQEYKKTGDKAAFETRLKSIGTAFAASLGTQLINLHTDPNSDQMVVMTLKDLDGDGQQDTRTIDLASLVGPATELNAEFAKGILPVFGINPAKATDSEPTFEQYKAMSPEDRMLVDQFRGKKTTSDKTSWDDRDKAVFKNLTGTVEKLANYDDLQALADAAASKLINSGVDTGFGTDTLATVAGALGRTFGVDSLSNFSGDVSALSSALREQVLPKVKALGAGTGISNADRDYAEKTVGSVNDTAESLVEKMALQRAIAEKGSEIKRLYQDAAAGAGEFDGMSPGDANRALQKKISEIEARQLDDPRGLKALTAKYQAQYLRQLYTKRGILPSGDTALGTPESAASGAQMDLSKMSDAELEALAGGQ